MTTPQNEFYRLGERIRHLTDLFEGDGDEDTIFDTIKHMNTQMDEVVSSMQRQEDLMNLIVKLLSKKDGK